MRKLNEILQGFCLCLLAIWAIGFTACQDEYSEPTGFLYLNVQEDATLLTKAYDAVVDESLQVAIIKADGDTLKVYQDYLREVKGERLILPVGTYTVAVSSNHDGKAHWETPFYAGSEEVIVEQGKIANSTVRCTIANTKVSVKYTESMGQYFSDYQTTVSNSSGELTYTRDEYRAGYFVPEKLTVQLDLVNRDGNEFTLKRVYPNVQPQSYYTFEFKINPEGEGDVDAGMDMDVSIDTEHNEIIYPIYIKQEDLTNAVRPSFKLTGFNESDTYAYKKESELPAEGTIQLTYTMGKESRLQYVKVSTNSPQFIAQGLGSFDWMRETSATALGFPAFPTEATEVIDMKASYTVDLSGIVQRLECTDGKPTTHSFTIELLDDKYQEASVSFKIKINPNIPAFVDPVVAVWSSFAVIKGYCADEESYFMVKADGGKEIPVKKISRNSEGSMTALLTGLQPGTYTYRIVSDNDQTMQCDSRSFTVTSISEVPNLTFDDWGIRTDKPAIGTSDVTYICANGTNASGGSYWESGNRGATSGNEVLLQGDDDAVQGKAAKLTSRWAGADLGLQKIGAFSAGSIFSGIVESLSADGATLRYGQPHQGYPTAFAGWYKYHPGIINWVDNKETSTSDNDEALIYVALTSKTYKLQSLRNDVKGVISFDPTDEGVIAYGELRTQSEASTYKQFMIPLVYNRLPAEEETLYIIIVATSSSKGDYFQGSTDSWMLLDECSLIYDYKPEALQETSFGSLQPNILSETSNE